ncbi:ExbD/TolR family protein [Aliiruegeria sabulilitoris]|uniref:ExbD/TolR family protein n=1 Tax=Aliiruegeria sabulilitoris TaxID=1510458 RepID=UPI00082CE76A|nr:biopolymer transporter ExbD [Pseudoruegeria sp. M32A2M]
MRIPEPPRRPHHESILPMINVVFLLLIFFMLVAQLTPPDPLDVTVPEAAESDPADTALVLFLSADSQLAFHDRIGDEALVALADAMKTEDTPRALLLRADRAVPGATVAALLPRLRALGVQDLSLVTVVK